MRFVRKVHHKLFIWLFQISEKIKKFCVSVIEQAYENLGLTTKIHFPTFEIYIVVIFDLKLRFHNLSVVLVSRRLKTLLCIKSLAEYNCRICNYHSRKLIWFQSVLISVSSHLFLLSCTYCSYLHVCCVISVKGVIVVLLLRCTCFISSDLC